MAPDFLIFCPSDSATQKSSHLCPPFLLKNPIQSEAPRGIYSEKPVQVTLENAYNFFNPCNIKVTILAVIDTS